MDLDTLVTVWPLILSLGMVLGAAGAGRYALGVITSRLDALTNELKETNKQLVQVSTASAVQSATLVAHTEQDRIQFDAIRDAIAPAPGASRRRRAS